MANVNFVFAYVVIGGASGPPSDVSISIRKLMEELSDGAITMGPALVKVIMFISHVPALVIVSVWNCWSTTTEEVNP